MLKSSNNEAREDILEKFIAIIEEKGEISRSSITEESNLCRGNNSLGLDSLVICDIATATEDKFEAVYDFLPQIRRHKTVGSLVDYIISLG